MRVAAIDAEIAGAHAHDVSERREGKQGEQQPDH
jgi:hypothetical protein